MPDLAEAAAPLPAEAPAEPGLALEFTLEPEVAQRLSRHPAIAAHRTGRSRGAAEELIWLDSAKGALAEEGLALEAPQRGPRRLLRSLPDPGLPPLPGCPAAEVEDSRLPDVTLVPIAAFSGRRSQFPLALPEGMVTATLRLGKLRAVADEAPVARLILDGPPEAVLALARRLAADLPLLPADTSLPEAGRALARGEAPRPRRLGAPDLGQAKTVEEAFLAALGHLLEVMLHFAPLCRVEAGPEGVHQLRVALRRLRSVLKVLRPALRGSPAEEFDAGLKALADRLGPARDWDVFLLGQGAAVAEAFPEEKRLATLLKSAEARRHAAYVALRQALDGAAFRLLMLDGLVLLLLRPWRAAQPEGEKPRLPPETPLEEFAAPLLDRRWAKLAAAGEEIEQHGPEALHEMRLDAKRLRYAAELFAPLWQGKATRRFLRRLAVLQDALGLANDAAVARALVASLGGAVPAWAVGVVEGWAAARARPARKRALESWENLKLAPAFWPDI
ncbi:CYTH and CHAD domain-containing protein [Siccirubricoccus phaeus]|uniref:CYTH and CHAD domain-containing protein n=1 Tax=Siccirubricoccus phaeus TaxID=2595053 RepID=UPI0011F1D61F|nr:CHAD domain-containing protein [Siccirubricoccus phaeus]